MFTLIPLESTWCRGYMLFQTEEAPLLAYVENGRTHIVISARLIDVHPSPKRAHQGWRYLTEDKAPKDLAEGEDIGDALPGKLAMKLERLGLV